MGKANQTITFGAQAGQTYSPGGTFAISPLATASSGLAITYSSLTTGVCTVAGTTVTMVTTGTCTIAANQAGDANYNAAPQVTQNVPINNPVPTTTSISPSGKIVGDAAFTLTVNGTNFIPSSAVQFAGSVRTTTYVSATQLTATIPASDLTTTGTYNITVVNPAPGGGTSNAQVFTVLAAVSSFNAFETSTTPNPGATSGFIKTKIAGSTFSLDVVAISGGAQASGFNDNVKVELLANTGGGPCTGTLLQTIASAAIAGGRSTVSFAAVADAWRDVWVKISYPTAAPTVISCSNDDFTIRPNILVLDNLTVNTSVMDADWQTAGATRTLGNSGATGGNVHKAGQPFTISVTARNAAGATTVNYTGSPTVKTLACTLPTPTCANGILTLGTWSGSGTVTTSTASYSEAGAFNLTLEDQTFASVDNADGSTTAERFIPQAAAVAVGRFVPDHFVVAAGNVPQLKTFNNAACAARSFTYIGQPFGYVTAPQALVTAQNAAGVTTANYSNNLWKLATAAGVQDCTTNPDICTLTSGSVTQTYTYSTAPAATPNWDSTQVSLGTPGIAANNDGTGTVASASGDLLAFKRSLATPQALFTANIALAESVKDASEAGNCGVANCDITTSTPAAFNPIAFDSGNEFRHGRLKLDNAYGSELLNLPVPMEAQYWNGTAFVTNTADNCTALVAGNIKLTAPPAGVSVTMGGAFSSGRGSLTLSKPTTPAAATVALCADLDSGATGDTTCQAVSPAAKQYLQTGTAYNQDPTAQVTFGVYRQRNEFIYLRETY